MQGGGDFLSSDGFMRRTRGLRGLGLDNKERRNSADQQPKLQLVFEVSIEGDEKKSFSHVFDY